MQEKIEKFLKLYFVKEKIRLFFNYIIIFLAVLSLAFLTFSIIDNFIIINTNFRVLFLLVLFYLIYHFSIRQMAGIIGERFNPVHSAIRK